MKKRTDARRWLKWLTPGIGVKRHFALLLLGAVFLGFAFALVLVEINQNEPGPICVDLRGLLGLPLWAIAVISLSVGGALTVYSTVKINQVILDALHIDAGDLMRAVVEQRTLERGPKIVAIGGGTGMPALLSGLKAYSANLTAIVTVADDGGSSGMLRRETGVLPPGDIRNNIAALARDEALMTQLFQYRFGKELGEHSFGNLFIAAMGGLMGSFEEAIAESSRVLAIRGKVMPSTLADLTLEADILLPGEERASRVTGESAITAAGGQIQHLFIQPDDAGAYPEARAAILSADMIVIGPGSLFTSILPNLLVKDISLAIRASRAVKVYVCNVATQTGETSEFDVIDHVDALERHVGGPIFDHVLVNDDFAPLPPESKTVYVRQGDKSRKTHLAFHPHPLADEAKPWRHDSEKVADSLMEVYERASAQVIEQPASHN